MSVRPEVLKLLQVATRIREQRNARWQKALDLQKLAAARRAGMSAEEGARILRKIDQQAQVWDLGDLVDELCEALDALERAEGL